MKNSRLIKATALYLSFFILSGCSAISSRPISDSTDTKPVQPKPYHTLIPAIKIATAVGRPESVALDSTGALLVAHDVGNIIWRASSVTET